MSQSLTRFLKPALVLGPLVALSFLAPSHPIDPWGIASPQKIARLILALSIVQIMSSFISGLKFRNVGVVITGFLGGLVSSTATTVALARRSKVARHEKPQLALVSLLSATNAMLAEALLLALVGLTDFPLKLLWVILPPARVTFTAR